MPTFSESSRRNNELAWDRAHSTAETSEDVVRAVPGILRPAKRRKREPKPTASTGVATSPTLPELPPPAPDDSHAVTYASARLDSRGRVAVGGFLPPGPCAVNVLPGQGNRPPQLAITSAGTGHTIDSRGRLVLPLAFRLLHHWRPADVLLIASEPASKSVVLTAARDVFGRLS